jgi:hypothetical protein
MIAHQHLSLLAGARPSRVQSKRLSKTDWVVRLIQALLAIYLLPVLMIILVVGAIGILMVAIGQILTRPARASLG